jgi:hypothetical protein
MKTAIRILTSLNWLPRQALKAAGYAAAVTTTYLLTKAGTLHESGLITDEGLAVLTDGVNAVGVVVSTVVIVGAEMVSSYFAKSRKE